MELERQFDVRGGWIVDLKELRKLRKRQIILTNLITITILVIYFTVTIVLSFSLSRTNTIVGILFFINGLLMLIRRDSPKSFIPTFEKIAIYEKEKMGDEWSKQRKTNTISMFVLSGLMFLNAYITEGSIKPIFHEEAFYPIYILLCMVMLITNVFLFLHIRKVDKSISKSDFAGYTLKTNIIGIVIGLVIAVVFIFLVIFYLFVTL